MPKLSPASEDYLEAIYNTIASKGFARTKDISEELKVSAPSVSEMLSRLKKQSLVDYEKYSGVKLTKTGEKIAKIIKKRHDTINYFLRKLLVSEKNAQKDACLLEHELSKETLEQITRFVDFVRTHPEEPTWIKHFKTFCKTGKHECKKAVKKT